MSAAMSRLFDDAPNYASTSFPEPRPFQQAAHEALRQGFRDGHKNQLIMAPTGAGKTYLGHRIAHEALMKGRKVTFLCDRTTLINQTSKTADAYGLAAHGIVQANHWRRNDMPYQIASAQTLAKRGYWPESDVIIIDEAHTQLKVWTEFIQNTKAACIGLSATPFSPGLGKLFTNLINATTMHDLTQSGVLVPMRVFTCKRADMSGAATSGGEWTDRAAEERGMEIIGDVVTEWVKFGENRKTIVFGATIKHCQEMARQFLDAGVMAAVFTSETTAAERELLIKEYSKRNSTLRVLISVEALAKGFDVPDVGCVVDCRPLRKSLSTAIQMWGRGLRSSPDTGKQDCIARDTLVLTDKGEVKIQDITLDHLVWDGQNFVSHAGAVCRGVQKVIEYDGLIATPDHEVMTNDGWKRFEEAAGRQLRIARTGFAGQPVRFADDCFSEDAGQRMQSARRSEVRQMWGAALRALSQHSQAPSDGGMSALQWASAGAGAAMAVPAMPGSVAAVQQPEQRGIRAIRGAWDRVSLFFGQRSGALGGLASWGARSRDAVGQAGQQRSLRAGEYSLDGSRGQHEQHTGIGWQASIHGVSQELPACEVRGCHSVSDDQSGSDGRSDKRTLADAVPQAEREVWDVLNAGPLQRFTANGRLVHNCLLLDHSGNITRFAEDYTGIFFDGLDALDMGEKLDKAIRKEPEDFEAKGCPSCGFKPFASRCMSCGFEKQSPALVEAVPGEMQEVMLGKKKLADDQSHLWAQLCTYARAHSAPDKQKWRARYLFRDMTGKMPPDNWTLEGTANVEITRNVRNKITSLNMARVKGLQKAVA